MTSTPKKNDVPKAVKDILNNKKCHEGVSSMDDFSEESKPLVDIFINPSEESTMEKKLLIESHHKRAKAYFDQANMATLYPNLFRILWYSTLPCFELPGLTQKFMTKSCSFGGHTIDCAKLFRKVPTDMGMCCALNNKNVFKESTYSKLIKELQASNKFSEGTVVLNENMFSAEAGRSNGLSFMLDLHSDSISFGSLDDDFGAFRVLIGEATEFPAVKEYGHLIEPGYHHFLSVSSQVFSASDIKSLKPKDRKCHFEDEGDLKFYERYSYRNCRFECSIQNTEKLVGCIPWYFPHGHNSTICDPWVEKEFMKLMGDAKYGQNGCEACLPDCQTEEIQVVSSAAKLRCLHCMYRAPL